MKVIKKFLLLALTLTLSLSIFACGGTTPCEEHTDDDANLVCDVCGETIEKSGEDEGDDGNTDDGIALIKNGVAQFQFVLSSDLPQQCRTDVTQIINQLADLGIEVKSVLDVPANKQDCEVLVGNVTTRGDKYKVNGYDYGKKGYAIKLIDQKIVIVAGSNDAIEDAISDFKSDILGLKKSTEALTDVVVPLTAGIEKKQEKFSIPSITIGTTKIDKSYVINVTPATSQLQNVAIKLRETIYDKTGMYLSIVNDETITEKCFLIKKVDNAGSDGFRAYVNGDSLVIETEFINKSEKAGETFVNVNLGAKFAAVTFKKSFTYSENVRVIRYTDEEFGAVADGYTNDFEAIKATHEYANKYNHTVVADSGRYYIGKTEGQTIPIQTNTDWTGATFIIDDSIIEWNDNKNRNANIFTFTRSQKTVNHDADSELVKVLNAELTRETKAINYQPGHKIMIVPYDDNHKVYIRYGANSNAGNPQAEVVVINADGTLDEDTPILLDYASVTRAIEYNVDELTGDIPITLRGGKVITKANRAPRMYTYYSRGIQISRANVTIEGIEHVIEGESKSHEYGAPYSGFFTLSGCNNFYAKNCILQSHLTHVDDQATDYGQKQNNTTMGSYDIGGSYFNLAKFENCIESNFYTDSTQTTVRPTSEYWGIMGTNYCKNIIYKDSVLSRLDAHAGVYNATVDGCKIIQINLIGGGTALIKDTVIYNNTLIQLREDYGSTWNGDIIIQNVHMMNSAGATPQTVLLSAKWNNHNFGYELYLPKNVIVDNLTVQNKKEVYVFSNYLSNAGNSVDKVINSELAKAHITEQIIIKNNTSNITFVQSTGSALAAAIPLVNGDDQN